VIASIEEKGAPRIVMGPMSPRRSAEITAGSHFKKEDLKLLLLQECASWASREANILLYRLKMLV
jgi:hypothetical protein